MHLGHLDILTQAAACFERMEVGALGTVFFAASPERATISSSTVRSLTSNGRIDAARVLVPACVGEALAVVADPVQPSSL